MITGYTRPLYILPFDHRASYIWGLFGWKEPLNAEQMASVANSKQVIYAGFQQALHSLKLLYFDCGSRDQYQLQFGARLLARALTQAGISYEYEEFDDDHTNIAYRYNVSLPKLAQVPMLCQGRAKGIYCRDLVTIKWRVCIEIAF